MKCSLYTRKYFSSGEAWMYLSQVIQQDKMSYSRKEFCRWSPTDFMQETYGNNFPQTKNFEFNFNLMPQVHFCNTGALWKIPESPYAPLTPCNK